MIQNTNSDLDHAPYTKKSTRGSMRKFIDNQT
jgi:hypothetical protein